MDDNQFSEGPNQAPAERFFPIPFSMLTLESLDDQQAALMIEAEPSDEDRRARRRILDLLYKKKQKLGECEAVLYALLDSTTDPQAFARIDAELRDVTKELDLCRARYSQIDRGRPFAQISREEETKLLAAIQAVGRAVANTNALSELLAATHELVEAFAAEQT